MDKLENYYRLKEDIELLDKFINDYFLSLERKDHKVMPTFHFSFNSLNNNGQLVIFKDINAFRVALDKSFCDMKLDLMNRTLEEMKKNLEKIKSELKEACSDFLKNECGFNGFE